MGFRFRAVKEAFTPEFAHPESKVVWLLRAMLAGLAVYSLAVEPTYTTRTLLVLSAAFGLLASVGFAFIPTQRPRTLKLAEILVLVAFTMHVVGHAFGIYQRFPPYDTILHLVMPLATVVVLYALSQATHWIWQWDRVRPIEVAIYLFCMTVTIATLWEILEFSMDTFFGTKEQDSLFDTMIDFIADVSGALVGSIGGGLVTRRAQRAGPDAVSEEPKRAVPSRAPRASE